MSSIYEKNQLITVTITDFGESGEGIGKVDGYTLFVKDAIVGDKVSALITKAKKNYAYARVHEIIEPSKDRVTPVCANASRCGGCQIQALSYDAQLRFKEDKVKNALIRIGGFESDFIASIMEPIVGADAEGMFRYRNKAQFPIGADREGNIIAGFYAGRTHNIIPCEDCQIGITENKDILEAILLYMKKYHIAAYDEKTNRGIVRHVLIRKGFSSGQIMVCLVVSRTGKITRIKEHNHEYVRPSELPNVEELIENLRKITGMTSICISVNSEITNVIMGNTIHLLWGKSVIEDTMHLREVDNELRVMDDVKATFEISPLSFYQVNPVQVEKLYSIALSYAELDGSEEIWDLCCGIGTISLCAAKYMEKINNKSNEANVGIVHGIEIVPEAIDDAKKNALKNNIGNVDFVCAPVEEYLPEHKKDIKADVIIMDPPRKGMDEKALEVVVGAKPKKIVYVSCDPATLARDLKFLCGNGYELKKVRPVDMFCHSVHCETVALLSYK